MNMRLLKYKIKLSESEKEEGVSS